MAETRRELGKVLGLRKEEVKDAFSTPRTLTRHAEDLKNASLFVKEAADAAKLAPMLHDVWASTVVPRSLERVLANPPKTLKGGVRMPQEFRTRGTKGLEAAHQMAVDGLITLIRKGFTHQQLLEAVRKTATPTQFKDFEAYLPRLH